MAAVSEGSASAGTAQTPVSGRPATWPAIQKPICNSRLETAPILYSLHVSQEATEVRKTGHDHRSRNKHRTTLANATSSLAQPTKARSACKIELMACPLHKQSPSPPQACRISHPTLLFATQSSLNVSMMCLSLLSDDLKLFAGDLTKRANTLPPWTVMDAR